MHIISRHTLQATHFKTLISRHSFQDKPFVRDTTFQNFHAHISRQTFQNTHSKTHTSLAVLLQIRHFNVHLNPHSIRICPPRSNFGIQPLITQPPRGNIEHAWAMWSKCRLLCQRECLCTTTSAGATCCCPRI